MIDLHTYSETIRRICTSLAVQRLDLVGSAARDDFQPGKSDIDVVVDFVNPGTQYSILFFLGSWVMRVAIKKANSRDLIVRGHYRDCKPWPG